MREGTLAPLRLFAHLASARVGENPQASVSVGRPLTPGAAAWCCPTLWGNGTRRASGESSDVMPAFETARRKNDERAGTPARALSGVRVHCDRTRIGARLVAIGLLAAGIASTAAAGEDGAKAPLVVAFGPAPLLRGLLEQALPPAPRTIALQTGYYGTVTLDHRAHLSRKISCRSCHGAGPVHQIEFTPRVAHDRCVGCHRREERGPTDCKGCHTLPVAETRVELAAKPTESAESPAGPDAVAAPPVVAAASVATTAAPQLDVATSWTPGEALGARPGRSVGIGVAAGPGYGPALQLTSRYDGLALEYSLERLGGGAEQRTLVLVGGGIVRPLRRDVQFFAFGLGGADLVHDPASGIMPCIGGRVGLERALPAAWRIQSVRLALTAQIDVANRESLGRDIGGAHVYATFATSFRLGDR